MATTAEILVVAGRAVRFLEGLQSQMSTGTEWLSADPKQSREIRTALRDARPSMQEDEYTWNVLSYVGATISYEGNIHAGRAWSSLNQLGALIRRLTPQREEEILAGMPSNLGIVVKVALLRTAQHLTPDSLPETAADWALFHMQNAPLVSFAQGLLAEARTWEHTDAR